MTTDRRQYFQDWRRKNKAHIQRYTRQYRGRRADVDLQRRYGITLEQRNAMLTKQRGCAGCHTVTSKHWHVDHDHKTGRVRGVLCRHCNWILGHARDDAGTLRRLARYLMK